MSDSIQRGRKPSEDLHSAIVALASEEPVTASTIQQRLAELPPDAPKATLPGVIKAARSLAAAGYLKLTESRPRESGAGSRARTMYKATPQGRKFARKSLKDTIAEAIEDWEGDGKKRER